MKIEAKADSLIILLEGFERLWALTAFLCIKFDDVTSVVWNAELPKETRRVGLRAPGTSVPTIFHAGSFWHRKHWDFYYLKDREPGELIITTRLHRYREVHITTTEAIAFEIREWFNVRTQTKNLA